MLLCLLFISFWGASFSDNTGYRPGVGTEHIFPDISENTKNVQFGVRNFYGIRGTFLSAISYNQPQFSVEASFLSLSSYYRRIGISFSLRHEINNIFKTGVSFSLNRELLPYNENRITFGISSGINLLPHINVHAGIYDVPEGTRIPLLVNIQTAAGTTGIIIEGESGLPLKLLLFQRFKISKKLSTYLAFSTAPNKMVIGLDISKGKVLFDVFSEIHDVLGQSGGMVVEYTPFKLYN